MLDEQPDIVGKTFVKTHNRNVFQVILILANTRHICGSFTHSLLTRSVCSIKRKQIDSMESLADTETDAEALNAFTA